MSIFLFSFALFILSFYLGFKFGNYHAVAQMLEKVSHAEGFLDNVLKEVDRRKNLSKLAKTRNRVKGRFVK